MSHRHQVIALSKLMTYILGHRPDEFGLVLDHDGFVSLKELQQAISEEEGWSYVRTSHITEVAYSIDREHFEIMDDRIRYALYTVRYEATLPPPILYHGTRRRAYPHIRERGIDPGGKQYVSLSTEPQLAMRIGRRRDPDPILVEIRGDHLLSRQSPDISGGLYTACLSQRPSYRHGPAGKKTNAAEATGKGCGITTCRTRASGLGPSESEDGTPAQRGKRKELEGRLAT
jgi:putative RNA 2'-phosphotransferase